MSLMISQLSERERVLGLSQMRERERGWTEVCFRSGFVRILYGIFWNV